MRVTFDGKTIWINYHHLYCFFVIAQMDSMVRAAETLGIGQSALSIQIKQFEALLGTPLFIRGHRSLRMTEEGEMIYAYATEIFRLGNEMFETLKDRPSDRRVHLEIGALDTIPKHVTVQMVTWIRSVMNCLCTVTEAKPKDLLDNLLKHRLDLVLTNSMPQLESASIYAKRIARMPLWIVGDRSTLKLKKNFPKSLNDTPMIVPTKDSSVRHEFENYCKRFEITPDFVIEAQDLMLQKLFAMNGTGATVMPEFAVQEYLNTKKLHLIGKLEGMFEELFLVSASRRIENPAAAELMKKFRL